MKMSVGVDLHKTQFTVYCLSEDRAIKETELYLTRIGDTRHLSRE
jgi:hypothetical protein